MKKIMFTLYIIMFATLCVEAGEITTGDIARTLYKFEQATGKDYIHSPKAIALLFGTACVESDLKYRKSFSKTSTDSGLFQMNKPNYNDIYKNYVAHRPWLAKAIVEVCGEGRVFEDIKTNDVYATVMARIHYMRVSETIPSTVEGMAKYWKKYYNTHLGKGKESKFVTKWYKYN